MSKQIVVISLLMLVAAVGFYFLLPASSTRPVDTPVSTVNTLPGKVPASGKKRYMLNVTLHTRKEIETLLSRAEKLSGQLYNDNNKTGIALVLHGPEVGFFTKKNYQAYKDIVDRARKLDKDKIIDIKVCRARMQSMNIKDGDIPSFIEIVPYGPTEIERLLKRGYLKL